MIDHWIMLLGKLKDKDLKCRIFSKDPLFIRKSSLTNLNNESQNFSNLQISLKEKQE